MLVVLALAILIFSMFKIQQGMRRRRPYKHAQTLVIQCNTAFTERALKPLEYVEQLNRLLKRSVLHDTHNPAAAPLSGSRWLSYLDELSGTTQFSDGPGQVLGDLRYQADTQADLSELHSQILALLGKLEKAA